jgi:peptide/nickel transport system permease protein
MKFSQILALLWILMLVVGIFWLDRFVHPTFTDYSIQKSLTWGYDAFGRSCIPLSLIAAKSTFTQILPLMLVTLFASLILASVRHGFRRQTEIFFSFWVDSFSILPGLLIALSWSAYFPGSQPALWAASGLILLPYLLRLWDGLFVEVELRPDYQSSIALGANRFHLLRVHVAPTLLRQLVALAPFLFTRLILIEVTFTFLGVGGVSQTESWGGLLFQGKDYLLEAPWILTSVSAPLFFTLFSFHLLSKPEKT